MQKFKTILTSRIGSHCHGINTPESDEDIRSIVIPTIDYFFGTKNFEQKVEKINGNDVEHWNITKFVGLLIKGNPSAMNILCVNKKDILFADEFGQNLLDNKKLFLSQRIIDACIGYVTSQLHKIDLGRGTKEGNRSAMIEKYGYDVKFIANAVMMANIALEVIKTNDYHALRPTEEQKYLRAIRAGEVPLQDARDQIRSKLETIKVIESTCKLPLHPDEEKINDFLTDFLQDYFHVELNGY